MTKAQGLMLRGNTTSLQRHDLPKQRDQLIDCEFDPGIMESPSRRGLLRAAKGAESA